MVEDTSFLEAIKNRIALGEIKLPPFNKTAMQVQQEAAKATPDIKKIEKLVICDQALTGKVLKMANSSFFTGFESIKTIRQAIVRLGIDEVVNVVTLAVHEINFRSKFALVQELSTKLWQHSVGCAFGCQWLAKNCGYRDLLHEVFFAGLLHDVGKLFLLMVIEDILNSQKADVKISRVMIEQMLSVMHTEQGYLLMKSWNLPEEYCQVARDHHEEQLAQNTSLLAIVRLVNNTCNKLGIGTTRDDSIVLSVSGEAEFLGLSEISIAELEVNLEDCMDKLGMGKNEH